MKKGREKVREMERDEKWKRIKRSEKEGWKKEKKRKEKKENSVGESERVRVRDKIEDRRVWWKAWMN